MKEYKINEVFTHNGVKLRVEENLNDLDHFCEGCYFENMHYNGECAGIPCMYEDRTDNMDVIFKEVEE